MVVETFADFCCSIAAGSHSKSICKTDLVRRFRMEIDSNCWFDTIVWLLLAVIVVEMWMWLRLRVVLARSMLCVDEWKCPFHASFGWKKLGRMASESHALEIGSGMRVDEPREKQFFSLITFELEALRWLPDLEVTLFDHPASTSLAPQLQTKPSSNWNSLTTSHPLQTLKRSRVFFCVQDELDGISFVQIVYFGECTLFFYPRFGEHNSVFTVTNCRQIYNFDLAHKYFTLNNHNWVYRQKKYVRVYDEFRLVPDKPTVSVAVSTNTVHTDSLSLAVS